MDIFLITDTQASLLGEVPASLPEHGFLWLDATHEEVAAAPDAWRAAVEQVTGVHLYDPHLTDAVNLRHPSYFDSTQDYEMVVFRKLSMNGEAAGSAGQAKASASFTKLATRPVTFVVMDSALVTVRAMHSRTIETARTRLLEYRPRANGNSHSSRQKIRALSRTTIWKIPMTTWKTTKCQTITLRMLRWRKRHRNLLQRVPLMSCTVRQKCKCWRRACAFDDAPTVLDESAHPVQVVVRVVWKETRIVQREKSSVVFEIGHPDSRRATLHQHTRAAR